MPNEIRPDEFNLLFASLPGQAAKRGSHAFTRLLVSAGRGRHQAAIALAALEFAADVADRRARFGSMPQAEQLIWESTGARFDRPKNAVEATRAATRAFGELLERSIPGDEAAAQYLGVNRSRVSQRVTEGSLYAFEGGDDRYFPSWQFSSNKTIQGLKIVLEALDRELHPLVVDHWFTTPNVDLEVNSEPTPPAAWLATGGDPTAAAVLAQDL